jgi:pimeloyl-ACP methyl ester carboxylesterase
VDGKVIPPSSTSSSSSSRDGHNHKERAVIVFLHGLLGNAKNLRTPAKIFTQRLPQYDALLLDVRGHGGSSSSHSATNDFTSPHNMQSCVQDVIHTLQHLGLHGDDNSPSVICGHSLGGRIALQYTHSLLHAAESNTSTALIQPPKQTWILDSVPGVADPSVSKVLYAISSLSIKMTTPSSMLSSSSPPVSASSSVGNIPNKTKSQMTTKLVDEYGLDFHVATWIVSSLRGIDEHSQRPIWAFDIDIAMELVQNFADQDFVGMIRDVVESAPSSSSSNDMYEVTDAEKRISNNISKVVQLVMAGKNESWTETIVSELQTIQSSFRKSRSTRPSPSSFKMHKLDKAGHWVHVDDLDGLMKLMVDELGDIE